MYNGILTSTFNFFQGIPLCFEIYLSVDPLHVCGNAVNLEYRTIRFFYRSEMFFCFVLQIGCIPTDVQGVNRPYANIAAE